MPTRSFAPPALGLHRRPPQGPKMLPSRSTRHKKFALCPPPNKSLYRKNASHPASLGWRRNIAQGSHVDEGCPVDSVADLKSASCPNLGKREPQALHDSTRELELTWNKCAGSACDLKSGRGRNGGRNADGILGANVCRAAHIPKEALMRIRALAILSIATVLTAAPARAQTYDPAYPVCLHVYTRGANYYDCR